MAQAYWIHASDGVRLRLCHWPCDGAKATILLFTGRTEYAEKYGRVARDLVAEGFTIISIDWRGQGLSDRVTDDIRVGHVDDFAHYQRDVAVLTKAADELGLPGPRCLLAHSMGGAIGLRALIEGLKVERAVFSSPMWGIFVAPVMVPVAKYLPPLARRLGQELRTVPGTRPASYLGDTPFLINLLTTDRDHFDYMVRQVTNWPEIAVGGPTLHWFARARAEAAALAAAPRPKVPTATFLGTREMVVDSDAIAAMHADWPEAELHIIEGGKHEMLMETPEIRGRMMAGLLSFLQTGKVEMPQTSI